MGLISIRKAARRDASTKKNNQKRGGNPPPRGVPTAGLFESPASPASFSRSRRDWWSPHTPVSFRLCEVVPSKKSIFGDRHLGGFAEHFFEVSGGNLAGAAALHPKIFFCKFLAFPHGLNGYDRCIRKVNRGFFFFQNRFSAAKRRKDRARSVNEFPELWRIHRYRDVRPRPFLTRREVPLENRGAVCRGTEARVNACRMIRETEYCIGKCA